MRKMREGKLLEKLEGHSEGINCLCLSIDESILVTGSEDSTAMVWAISEEDPKIDKRLGILS